MTLTFRCGHPRTWQNTVGIADPRCRICRYRAKAMRAEKTVSAKELRQAERNISTFEASRIMSKLRGGSAIDPNKAENEAVQQGSRNLLRALYREHPYVFDAAERSGRYVVRP